jgi:hypothetical protein
MMKIVRMRVPGTTFVSSGATETACRAHLTDSPSARPDNVTINEDEKETEKGV